MNISKRSSLGNALFVVLLLGLGTWLLAASNPTSLGSEADRISVGQTLEQKKCCLFGEFVTCKDNGSFACINFVICTKDQVIKGICGFASCPDSENLQCAVFGPYDKKVDSCKVTGDKTTLECDFPKERCLYTHTPRTDKNAPIVSVNACFTGSQLCPKGATIPCD